MSCRPFVRAPLSVICFCLQQASFSETGVLFAIGHCARLVANNSSNAIDPLFRAKRIVTLRVVGGSIGLKVIGALTASEDFGAPPWHRLRILRRLPDEYGVRYAIWHCKELPSAALSDTSRNTLPRFRNVIIVPELPGISALGVTSRDLV